MAFTEQEKQIITFGRANGKSREEVEDAIAKLRSGFKPTPKVTATPAPVEKNASISRLGDIITKQGDKYADEPSLVGKTATLLQTPLRLAGEAAVMAGEQVARPILAAGEALSNTDIIKKIAESPDPTVFESVASKIGGTITGALDAIKGKVGDDIYRSLADSVEVLSLLVGGKGAKIGAESAMGVAKGAAETGIQAGKQAVEAVANKTQGITDVTGMAVRGATNIPGRIATNIAEKRAVEETIRQLPTVTAQKAARNGIDPNDVRTIYELPSTSKSVGRELADNIKKYAKRETDVDPIEIVGRPIVSRLKELEEAKGTIGQKLGEVSKKLGVVTKEEATAPVFDSLKSVPGLSGLTVDKNGVLNFKNTVLTTAETASDRKAIQNIYTQATRWGNGEAKHKLRQELFEILGGKKKAGVQLTDTQDKAYQAIRKGLSDVLDAKNSEYKKLNMEFAKVAQPVSDIRKAMQTVPGATDDVLDMGAGLIARRLTSTSLSQGKIRAILDAMDTATGTKGNLRETVENTQKLYNILGKYYDIAPSTGFQGQVRAGVESAGGVTEFITNAARELAGETTAVRQKAIEDALREALAD
jgi:hypothetical protein